MSAADDWDAAEDEWAERAINVLARSVGDAHDAYARAHIRELWWLYAMLSDLNLRFDADYYAWELESNIGPRRLLPPGMLFILKARVEFQLRQYGQQLD